MQGIGAGLVEEADALFLAQFADEQVAILLHDNISVEALHHHLVEHGGMYDGVVRFVEIDVVANGHVAVFVGVGMFAQGVPAAQVAPAEVGGIDEDFLGLFHDGVVHGDAFAEGEALVDHGLFFGVIVVGEDVLEGARDFGMIHAERVDNSAHAPDEDARVPEEVVLLDILEGCLHIGFFAEGIHAENVALARGGETQVGLDISVARLGMGGLDAEGDDGVGFGSKLQAVLDSLLECLHVHDDVVAGCHNYVGARVALLDFPTDVADAGGRVASAGLYDDVGFGHFGQLFVYLVAVLLAGGHPYVFGQHDTFESFKGQLNQRFAATENVEELFWVLVVAEGPQARTNAAGQYDEVSVLHSVDGTYCLLFSISPVM